MEVPWADTHEYAAALEEQFVQLSRWAGEAVQAFAIIFLVCTA